MADFDPAFATSGERREPTVDEQNDGFQCGPVDMFLFNWLFWSLQSEIKAVLLAAGLTPNNGDMTQLLQAINALIAAATGGGDPSGYLTMIQARARLPIFPEVQNANAHFGVITPASNQIRVPAGVTFQHRGIFPVTTAQTDIAVNSSTTYHLRWDPTNGFNVKDVTNAVYNPTAVDESDPKFDSTYDDMLVARIVVNGAGVPTITNLINKDRLKDNFTVVGTVTTLGGQNGARLRFITPSYNWARTPINRNMMNIGGGQNGSSTDQDLGTYSPSYPTAVTQLPRNRYGFQIEQMRDFATSARVAFDIGA